MSEQSIQHIDVMVKPFSDSRYLPINKCSHIIENPFDNVLKALAEKNISIGEYLEICFQKWKRRIDFISKHPDSYLVMIDISYFSPYNRPQYITDLINYANNLLENRFFLTCSGFSAAGILSKKVSLLLTRLSFLLHVM